MTRIAFTADLHVDQYGSRIDAATGLNARLVDYLTTVRFVAAESVARDATALVVAGDFCERKHVNSWLAGKIGEALAGGPSEQVFLRGNHDGEIAGESIVSVLGRMSPDWIGITRPHVVVVGDTALCLIPHLDPHWIRAQPGFESLPPDQVNVALAEQFVAIARGLYAQALEHVTVATTILVVHQGLSGGRMSDSQAAFLGDRSLVVDAAALGAIGFDAIVAGHFHGHQVLSTDPLTVYTGSVERVDFAEEHQAKGFVVIDTEKLPAFEFVETPARRYITVDAGPDGEELGTLEQFDGAIVRVLNVPADRDPGELRRFFENAGAFEVTEIRRAPVEQQVASTALSETLAPAELVETYFADHPDRDALVERGREILEAVAS